MAMWDKDRLDFLDNNKTLFETNVLATKNGAIVDSDNPLPVSIGGESVTITGDVTIPGTINVTSAADNPVHNHITQVGTGAILTDDYLPVGGTVALDSASLAALETINIGTIPEVEIKNDTGNPLPVELPPTQLDSFGRLRVSNPLTLFNSSHRYAKNDLWFEDTTGTASSTFNAPEGLIDMNIGTASGDEVLRETTKVFVYQPGKSLLVMNTFTFDTAKTNLRQRVGYFGSDNGIFLQQNDSTVSFVMRSYVTGSSVDTTINQSSWNGDKLDGTGASGLTLDLTKVQIQWMDLEWLGAGQVRIGFIINGIFIICHTFYAANVIGQTYMTTASLPLRYEITNTGTVATPSELKQICSTVISEGGAELSGRQQAVGTPITAARSTLAGGAFLPIASIRLKAARLDSIVILTALSILGDGSGNFNWQVRAASTTTGGTWISAGANSSVDYNLTGTATTGGRTLASGYFSATNQSNLSVDILKEALFKFQLERDSFTSTPIELTLMVAGSGSGDPIFGSLDWEEITR